MPDDLGLPAVQANDGGHVELHNEIRRILIEHQHWLARLEARVARLEPRNWLPEQPGRDDHPPRRGPELPEQPPREEAPPPEYPAGNGNGSDQWRS